MSHNALGFEIRMLSNLINRRINQMITEEEDTLTAHHTWVLRYLIDHMDQNVIQRDLEKHFSIRRSTISHMLQLMERSGYIVRVPVPDDARQKRILPTKKGVEAHNRMIDRLNRFETMLQSGITNEEVEQLLETVEKLKRNVQ